MTTSAQDAISRKKLRVDWDAPELPSGPSKDVLLEGLFAVVRQRHRAPENSQDERVEVRSVTAESGGARIKFRYVFDNDFASQYDETEKFEAELTLDGSGGLVDVSQWSELSS